MFRKFECRDSFKTCMDVYKEYMWRKKKGTMTLSKQTGKLIDIDQPLPRSPGRPLAISLSYPIILVQIGKCTSSDNIACCTLQMTIPREGFPYLR